MDPSSFRKSADELVELVRVSRVIQYQFGDKLLRRVRVYLRHQDSITFNDELHKLIPAVLLCHDLKRFLPGFCCSWRQDTLRRPGARTRSGPAAQGSDKGAYL